MKPLIKLQDQMFRYELNYENQYQVSTIVTFCFHLISRKTYTYCITKAWKYEFCYAQKI